MKTVKIPRETFNEVVRNLNQAIATQQEVLDGGYTLALDNQLATNLIRVRHLLGHALLQSYVPKYGASALYGVPPAEVEAAYREAMERL